MDFIFLQNDFISVLFQPILAPMELILKLKTPNYHKVKFKTKNQTLTLSKLVVLRKWSGERSGMRFED